MDRQLLSRATENSDAPTPGYMYLDIAKNAATNPATCADIAKYLSGRLASKNNHNIKYKCLKVISKTCTSPYLRGQFKRCMAQDPQAMAAIKDALQFRGPPDPVRGDQPYERVREAAKEALDSVYSDTPAESSGAPFATSVSSSYAPSPHQGGGYGGQAAPGSRRMEGIGNPMFKDPRMEPQQRGLGNMTVNDVVKEAKETVIGMIKDPLAKNTAVGPPMGGVGNMPRPGGFQGASYSSPPPGRSELMHETGGQWTMASNRGPDAVGTPANYGNDSAYYKSRDQGGNAYSWAQKNSNSVGGVGGSWASSAPSVAAQSREPAYGGHQATPSITVNSAPGIVTATGGGGTAVSDGSYERQLIMELCPPGGMKPEPPPDKLAQFARSVSSLNPDFICPVLLDCLEEGQPWIIRAKALWVIEVCMKHGQRPGTQSNPYADFFHACQGEIAPMATHTRAAVRDPAKRVLGMLGVATPVGNVQAPGSAPVAAPPSAAPPAAVPNLLDFDEPAPPAPAAPPPAAAPLGTNSLFGGLNVASKAPAPVAPPATPPAAPANENLLGDFISEQAATSVPQSNGGSLFGDMNVKENAAASAQPSSASVNEAASMFDNLALKTEEKKGQESSDVASPVAGSAFGFINQTASTDTNATDKKPDAQPAASRDSFDPLKNLTPGTAKQMMQISPEQMQAMAYQQMMMQQQMQMAQMMAMQQQAQRGSGGNFMPMRNNMMVMQNPAAAKTSFAFMETPGKQADKSFDFVRDAMSKETKK